MDVFLLIFQDRILGDLSMEMETTSNRLDFVQVCSFRQDRVLFCNFSCGDCLKFIFI